MLSTKGRRKIDVDGRTFVPDLTEKGCFDTMKSEWKVLNSISE